MDRSITVARKALAAPQKEAAKRRSLGSFLTSHARRALLEALNLFLNHDWLFWIVGAINKRVGLIQSVFLVYPASEEYALSYAYPARLRKNQWTPWPCGLLWQNGRLSVMFCISASNGQFSDPDNLEKVRGVCERMEHLRALLGAKGKTFAGILPGVLFYKRVIRDAPEADLTASVVCQAIEQVKSKEGLDWSTPLIVLGGRGFIGRRVVKLLDGAPVYCIDVADGGSRKDWLCHLEGRRVIVVNITLNNALADYVDEMRPGTVVLNEVYPEPSREILDRLERKGCVCYHVVGVKAFALPSFPAAYRGAIPCCAAWPSADMKAVVRKL
jgi:hypothetical protein